jgi:hypothetical protein
VHSRIALLALCIVVWLGFGEVLMQATPPPSSPKDLVQLDIVSLQPPQAGSGSLNHTTSSLHTRIENHRAAHQWIWYRLM